MPYKKDEYKNKEKYGPSQGYKKRPDYIDEEKDPIIHHLKEPRADYLPLRVKEEKVISSRLVPRVDNDTIKSLKLVSTEVIGGIFDRVIFLGKRIEELRENVALRKQIHEQIGKEIEKDIDDRMQFLQALSDPNERRNLKLDISVLRKERRNEDVQYWRDLVELNTELRKMEEEFEIETKIAGIFNNGSGEVTW